MRTSGINHVSIHADDLETSVRFYVELLDAEVLDTPNFGVPVQWLALGDTQLHIFIRDAKPQSHHHFAITVEDLEPVYRRAEAMGALDGRSHGHHIIELPGDVAQTYVRDPAGNLMEIDTPGASRLAGGAAERDAQARRHVPAERREPAGAAVRAELVAAPERQRDAERTRAEILDAATSEFAEHGYSGARVDVIAERTRTTKRMLYYYFENKAGLYTAVLERAYGEIRERERQLDVEGLDPVAAIRRLAELTFDHHESHPDFIRLVSIENIHRAEHLAGSKALARMRTPAIDITGRILERGYAEGSSGATSTRSTCT